MDTIAQVLTMDIGFGDVVDVYKRQIVRLAMCPREAVPFHGTLSRHGIT